MTVKELNCIYSSVWNAKEIIENLACENYPYTEFEDKQMRKMFYDLNRMCITINRKIKAAEKAATK